MFSNEQRKRRLTAANWFLSKTESFFTDQVIWTDEKYFVLKQCPNRKNSVIWAPANPHVLVQCKSQSNQKAMCWTGLYNGKVIGPFWIQGTMDRNVYNTLLKDDIWPSIKGVTTRHSLYFMQDGATCHTVAENLKFLDEKFSGRVISNKTDIPWPPNSPDLNPLDFFFWGHAMNHVYRVKPETIDQMKSIVNDFSASMDSNLIKKVCGSARKRFGQMREAYRGHFEHLL